MFMVLIQRLAVTSLPLMRLVRRDLALLIAFVGVMRTLPWLHMGSSSSTEAVQGRNSKHEIQNILPQLPQDICDLHLR